MRMSCNKTDDIPLIMYAKPKQMDNIIKSLRLDTNIVEHITKTPGIAKTKVKEINLVEDEMPTSKYCKGIKKIPCGIAAPPKKPRTFPPLENPIGGEDTEEDDGDVKDVKKADEEKTGVDTRRMDECKSQSSKNTMTGRTIRWFLSKKNAGVSREWLIKNLKTVVNATYHSQLINNNTKYTKYGYLLIEEDGLIKLHDDYIKYSK